MTVPQMVPLKELKKVLVIELQEAPLITGLQRVQMRVLRTALMTE